jgi:hypothetical protein
MTLPPLHPAATWSAWPVRAGSVEVAVIVGPWSPLDVAYTLAGVG